MVHYRAGGLPFFFTLPSLPGGSRREKANWSNLLDWGRQAIGPHPSQGNISIGHSRICRPSFSPGDMGSAFCLLGLVCVELFLLLIALRPPSSSFPSSHLFVNPFFPCNLDCDLCTPTTTTSTTSIHLQDHPRAATGQELKGYTSRGTSCTLGHYQPCIFRIPRLRENLNQPPLTVVFPVFSFPAA